MNWLTRSFSWAPDAQPVEEKATWSLDNGRLGGSDRDNFITNRVTVAEHDDGRAYGSLSSLGLSATWACVTLIAGTIGSLPLMMYRLAWGGGREVARGHPLYTLLHDDPNADQTSVDFLEYLAASVELHGNGFAAIDRGLGGKIVALAPIRPDLVSVKRSRDGDLIYTWSDHGKVEARQSEMLHVRGPGGGPLGGASPLALCRGAFQSALAAERAAAATFRNGARPSGVLSMETRFDTPEKRQEMQNYLGENYAGSVNAGRPMLLDGGLKWEQMSINPVDAQMLESRRFSGEEVCRIFGIPPGMVGFGDKASNWGTGKEVDVLGFQKFTLRRRLKRIEAAMMKQLLTAAERTSGLSIEFNLEGLLRGDSAGRADFYGKMTQLGAMTINEVRALENLPPVAGGNVPRMQMQNVPITDPGAPPALPQG